MFSDLVKQNSWWSGKWRMHPFSRNGSTMSPAKPAKKLPTPFPMVSSPRANSLSSGVTRRPAAWGECTTIIPASSPIEEQRRIMIHMKGTKWKHDSNKRKTRWAVSKTERGKTSKTSLIFWQKIRLWERYGAHPQAIRTPLTDTHLKLWGGKKLSK